MIKHRTDQEFFEHYCACADVVFNNGEDEVAFIKNLQHEFSYLSPQYLKAVSPVGTVVLEKEKQHTELQQRVHETVINQDQEIHTTLKPKVCLYVDIYDRIGIIRKYPIINPDTNNVVGTIGLVSPYTMPNILATLYKINGIKHQITTTPDKEQLKYELSEKQNMVLFLYLNKYSNAEIAEILTMLGYPTSKPRVNDHLKSLKFIFHAKTKEELIDKGISLNYHLLLPRKFLQIGSYEIEDEIIIAGEL